jgi:predicted phage-related endonuclease
MTDRSRYIGGTDAAPILGVSRWRTPLDVYAEKTDDEPAPDRSNERMRLGLVLESTLLDEYERQKGVTLIRHPDQVDPERPFLRGHPDGIAPDAIVDAKVAWDPRPWILPDGRRRVPIDYVLQGLHYCGLDAAQGGTSRRVDFAVLLAGSVVRFEVLSVTFTDDDIADLRDRLVTFWRQHVEPRIPPPWDGSRAATARLARMYPTAELTEVVATPEIAAVADRLRLIRAAERWIDDQRAAAENAIKGYMGDHAVLLGDGWRVTWKNDRERIETAWESVATYYARLLQAVVDDGTMTAGGVDIRNAIDAARDLYSVAKPGARRFLPRFDKGDDDASPNPIRRLAAEDDGAHDDRHRLGRSDEPHPDADDVPLRIADQPRAVRPRRAASDREESGPAEV